ncbi:hypothetical protein [Algivirga pacifica]|uniref:Uncharacterized protein n=1 Tax=Algivirga pacifica TaxID=1162670 RepID=A0ABP9D9B3_9BACT
MDQNYLKNLAGELLNLEVNTIVKENTTGAKMPTNRRVALLEIANEYRHTLVAYGLCAYANGNPAPKGSDGREKKLLRWQGAGEYSFKEIKHAATAGKNYYEEIVLTLSEQKDQDALNKRIKILQRIEAQSAAMIGIFKSRRLRYNVGPDTLEDGLRDIPMVEMAGSPLAPIPSQLPSYIWNNDLTLKDVNLVEDLELTPDNLTVIRKAWELGTQQVLLQTIVQIDGDVTNYLTNHFINLPPEIRKIALEMHTDSTTAATKHWSELFKTVSQLAGKALGQIFNK